ncbi:MAG: hypothetical protein AMJ65_07175 [Phycisphaerae bacterium SG8_4]|nr:MAG: hypothetical protein AMJ65_07175 [Phycisphaerae bacterium SG8_4]
MKRMICIVLAVSLTLLLMIMSLLPLARSATISYGLTHYNANRGYIGSGTYNDPLYNFINEVETELEASMTIMIDYYPAAVELDGTAPPTLTAIGTDGQANISALAFDADGGSTGDDIAFLNWTVPDGYVADSARLNVWYSFSTAEDAADEAQFDFTVQACAAGEALDAAGTALADQTTVIAAGNTDNGKLHITQYNIEVEDIAVDDLVIIMVTVDESASALANSGTLDVHKFVIEYESSER